MKSIFAVILAGSLASAWAQKLEMFWVDVEGGAATLIVTPAGESILIDTGMPGERDPGRIHKVATEAAGVKRIDHLITTHFHIDHYGGAADLSRLMPIVNAYDYGIPEKNPDNPADPNWERTIRPYREMQVEKRVVLKPGDKVPLKQHPDAEPISIECLIALRKTIEPPARAEKNGLCDQVTEKGEDRGDNANSIGVILRFGNFKMFDGGDLTWNVEAMLACPVNLVGPVDVYDVNHHGLDQSNNPVLVRSLAPTVAIMGNGVTKGCGPETFQTLKSTPSIKAIYQLHKNLRNPPGVNTEDELIANLERECDANFVQVTVQPDARTYAVSIPATGHSRTFQTR